MDVSEPFFDDLVVERSHELPVVVDFWASWCGPCLALGPVLEREVEARAGAVELAKVDVDANPDLARRFSVSGIPAVKAFRDGRVVAEFVGALSPASVSSFVDELLASPADEVVTEELRSSGEHPDVLGLIESGDLGAALERILTLVIDAGPDERERLRAIAVALYDRLGHDDPVVVGHRRRLAAALY